MKQNHEQNTVQIEAEQAAKRFLRHREDEVRRKTLIGQATPINRFATWCADNQKQLHQLNGFDLQEFYDTLRDDGNLESRATLRNYMSAVR